MTDAIDVSTAQLTLAVVGTVGVGTLLFLVMQMLKDFFPALNGRAALGVVYALSLAVALALLYQAGADWRDPLTYLSALLVAIGVAVVGKGVYAQTYGRQITVTRARLAARSGPATGTITAGAPPEAGGVLDTPPAARPRRTTRKGPTP